MPNTFRDAVIALVEAAEAAGIDMTPRQYGLAAAFAESHEDEDVAAALLQLQALRGEAEGEEFASRVTHEAEEAVNEAGGFASWAFRALQGADMSLERELREEMQKIENIAQRDLLAEEIMKFLKEAKAAQREGALTGLLRAFGITVQGAAGSATVGFVAAFRASLAAPQGLLQRIAAWFTKGSSRMAVAAGAGTTAAGAAASTGATVFMAAAVISMVWRAVNRHNGKIDDYVTGLEKVYGDVKRMKVPKG